MTTTVIALGGNALVRRGEELAPAAQERNVALAAAAIGGAIGPGERLVLTHGNGPQVGALALADASRPGGEPFGLDVLDAETEGMIGYLLARHLHAACPGRAVAPLLTQVVVDPADPAFAQPTKPVGPNYSEADVQALRDGRGWTFAPDGKAGWRRVVASPAPLRIVELEAIRLLLEAGVVVVCAGGGGVPVADDGEAFVGVEAVVDKDATSSVLAAAVDADRFVMLTDVDAVVEGWGTPGARPILSASPRAMAERGFAAGSMAPKVRAACWFAETTSRPAVIGSLDRAADVLAGRSGTLIRADVDFSLGGLLAVSGPS